MKKSERIIKNRQSAVRRQFKDKNLDGLIVTATSNVRYLTGFTGEDSWVFVTSRRVYLLTDSRFTEQAEKECVKTVIKQRKGRMSELLSKIIAGSKAVDKVGIEKSVSFAALEAVRERLRKVKVKVKPAAGIVESLRVIKADNEVRLIKQSGKIAAKVFSESLKELKPGITENEWTGIVEYQMRRFGVIRAFETIVAFGKNGSIPHYQPGNVKLRGNDNVLIDFGVSYKGYRCDISRSFPVGNRGGGYAKALKVVKAAQRNAIAKIKPGVKAVDIDKAAREMIKKAGFTPHGHGTGHGLGLDVHEKPVLSYKSKDILKSGMVVTIEPGIYLPGKFGVRVEDDVLVTDKGYRILTKTCPYG
jgi:Xaa-Pro aminopeptidase